MTSNNHWADKDLWVKTTLLSGNNNICTGLELTSAVNLVQFSEE